MTTQSPALPSLLDPLEELDADLAREQTSDPDALPDLDDLMAESLGQAKQELLAKTARERFKRGSGSAQERAEDAERIRAWEAAHEYTDVANVALWERHKCACGAQSTIFRHFMTRQVHRYLKATQRWLKTEEIDTDLPNETMVQKWNTPMCTKCAPEQGWEFKNVTEWEG